MASLSSSRSDTISKPRKHFPIERRPLMLKDILRDDMSSCSSNGFRSFPRRACYPTMRNLLETDLKTRDSNNTSRLLIRSRSKAASTTISALQKASLAVINAVKNLPFYSIKSPLSSSSSQQYRSKHAILLPRSLSRRVLKRRSFWRRNDKEEQEITIGVKVKDIIRWKSFKDVVEENHKPSDFSLSPLRCTITTTTTTSNSNSNSISWSDNDFTSEYVQSSSRSSEYSSENETEESKKYLPENKTTIDAVGKGSMAATTNSNSKGEYLCEEKQQFSPVSVLDFPFEDDEDTSSIQRSLANMEKAKQKLMQKIRRFENLAKVEPVNLENRIALSEHDETLELPRDSSCSISIIYEEEQKEIRKVEEKARELLNLIKTTSTLEGKNKSLLDRLLLDMFRDGIMGRCRNTRAIRGAGDDDQYEHELVKIARDWINGDQHELLEWGVIEGNDKQAYVRDMEKGGRWSKFDEEQGKLVLEMEMKVLNSLMDELVFDFLY